MTRIVAVIVLAFILIPSTAQARHHHYRHPYYQIAPMTWGHVVQHQPRHHRRHRTARSHHRTIDASGNRAFEIVRTAEGLTAKVAASAKEKFQGFIDAVEADIIPDMGVGYFVDAKVIKGNRISDIGCLSRGHMPGSKTSQRSCV